MRIRKLDTASRYVWNPCRPLDNIWGARLGYQEETAPVVFRARGAAREQGGNGNWRQRSTFASEHHPVLWLSSPAQKPDAPQGSAVFLSGAQKAGLTTFTLRSGTLEKKYIMETMSPESASSTTTTTAWWTYTWSTEERWTASATAPGAR